MLLSIAGFATLALFALVLFSLAFFEAVSAGFGITAVVLLGVLLALLYQTVREGVSLRERILAGIEARGREDLYDFLALVVGSFATFVLSVTLGLGPVVAAGVIGIAATLFAPKWDVPAYCGAFVGMACHTVFGYPLLTAATLVAGVVYVASRDGFGGFGGKLGTIAFSGCVLGALLRGGGFTSAAVPDWGAGRLLILYSVLGAVITYVISVRLGHSAVISSGFVGVVAGLVLPVIHPELGVSLGVVAICASFAGMSAAERMPNEGYMVAAGVLCALVFMYTSPYLGGAGGKLGTIAFGSVIALRGMRDLADVTVRTARTIALRRKRTYVVEES